MVGCADNVDPEKMGMGVTVYSLACLLALIAVAIWLLAEILAVLSFNSTIGGWACAEHSLSVCADRTVGWCDDGAVDGCACEPPCDPTTSLGLPTVRVSNATFCELSCTTHAGVKMWRHLIGQMMIIAVLVTCAFLVLASYHAKGRGLLLRRLGLRLHARRSRAVLLFLLGLFLFTIGPAAQLNEQLELYLANIGAEDVYVPGNSDATFVVPMFFGCALVLASWLTLALPCLGVEDDGDGADVEAQPASTVLEEPAAGRGVRSPHALPSGPGAGVSHDSSPKAGASTPGAFPPSVDVGAWPPPDADEGTSQWPPRETPGAGGGHPASSPPGDSELGWSDSEQDGTPSGVDSSPSAGYAANYAAAVPGVPTLPPGWSAHTDPTSGDTYYAHEDGDTSWEYPEAPGSPNPFRRPTLQSTSI